jgi:hypothetical protein
MARPKVNIDPDQLESLAGIQCTQAEAAAVIGITQAALSQRLKTDKVLADAWENGRARGKASLRRKQYEAAMKGDRTMLIWLGKNWLGQADKLEQDIGSKDGTAVKFVAEWGQGYVPRKESDPTVEADKQAE